MRPPSRFIELSTGEKLTLKQAALKFNLNLKRLQNRWWRGDRGERLIFNARHSVSR